MSRRTKIVCTIGPESCSEQRLRELIEAGMDVARLNFSHGTQEEQGQVIERIRRLSAGMGKPVGVLQDLGGPKIRVGTLKEGSCVLKEGDEILLTSQEVPGDSQQIGLSYPRLLEDIEPGDPILLNDGAIELEASERIGEGIRCKVKVGGCLLPHKGVNFPRSKLRVDALTPKDREDLLFGIQRGVDFVALSFVQRAEDIAKAKAIIEHQGVNLPVIAKIEKREALTNLQAIIQATDGVMVARGDLGVEAELEDVPLAQKRIIRSCNQMGKPVITATQMLDSMRESPQPTRAEVSDVANAILDGTDAVMLSQETAVGKFPVQTVEMMGRIAVQTESALEYGRILRERAPTLRSSTAGAISHATCQAAEDLCAAAIITPTESGSTARMVARYRPRAPIIAVSPNPVTVNRLCLIWGVYPIQVEEMADTDDMVDKAMQAAVKTGLVKGGDRAVITAGIPIGVPGTTNLLRVLEIPG